MGNELEKWDDLDAVFLLGAGASKPLGLPLSNELWRGYVPRIMADRRKKEFFYILLHTFNTESIYRKINSNASLLRYAQTSGSEIVSSTDDLDIEYIFSFLESFERNIRRKKDFLSSFNTLRAFIFARYYFSPFITTDELLSDYKVKGKDRLKSGLINKMINNVDSLIKFENLINQVNKDLKTYIQIELGKTFDSKQTLNYYTNLFDGFFNEPSKKKLILFTTNYDLSLENALEEGESNIDVYIGFEPINNRMTFVDNKSKIINMINRPVKNKTVYIFKIHGSVDWQKYKGKIVRGSSVGINDPHDLYLIYPGVKNWEDAGIDEVDSRIFRILHDVFKEILKRSKALISVGFAFRDKYIYQLIKEALLNNDNLKIHSINPSFPKDSYFPLLKSEFPERVFHEALKIVFDLNDESEKAKLYLSDNKNEPRYKSLCDLYNRL